MSLKTLRQFVELCSRLSEAVALRTEAAKYADIAASNVDHTSGGVPNADDVVAPHPEAQKREKLIKRAENIEESVKRGADRLYESDPRVTDLEMIVASRLASKDITRPRRRRCNSSRYFVDNAPIH